MKPLMVALMVLGMLAAAVLAAYAIPIDDPDAQVIYLHNLSDGHAEAGIALSWQLASYREVKAEVDVVLPADLDGLDWRLGVSVSMAKVNKRLTVGVLISNKPTVYIGWRLN